METGQKLFIKRWIAEMCKLGSSGLVVMGDKSCLKGRGSNPGAIYWMDNWTFSHCFVVKMVLFF